MDFFFESVLLERKILILILSVFWKGKFLFFFRFFGKEILIFF